jgi:hypothetical protein
MKVLLLSFFAMMLALNSMSQIIKLDGVYKFVQATKLKECDVLGFTSATEQVINSGWRFHIERKMPNNDLVISFGKWSFNPKDKNNLNVIETENKQLNTTYRGSQANSVTKFFLLPVAEFSLRCKEVEPKVNFVVGTASTVIKYRPGSSTVNSEIGNDLNIGAMFGFRINHSQRINHYLLGGFNVGSIKLTPSTTVNFITNESNVSSLAPTVAYVIEIDKFQIGAFSGIDILSGSVYKNWVYRGRPWIGIGIGIAIFKSKSEDKANQGG